MLVKYPNFSEASWGFPNSTQLKDGFIRLRGFASHWPSPQQDKSDLGLTQPTQAYALLPKELLFFVEIALWSYAIAAYFVFLYNLFPELRSVHTLYAVRGLLVPQVGRNHALSIAQHKRQWMLRNLFIGPCINP